MWYAGQIVMSTSKHRLSEKNTENGTAVCAECGPVSIRPKGSRRIWRCVNGIREAKGSSRGDVFAQLLKKKYGITRAVFAETLIAQTGRCAICTDPLTAQLQCDHDHETGRFRGLLCGRCNRGLRVFMDDPNRLRAAAAYLDR